MTVYHASKFIIELPDVYHSRDLLDFGKGFYLTSLVEQAKKYAQRFLFQGDKAYLNQYILDEKIDKEYKIKNFIDYDEEWLDFVALCRLGKQSSKYDIYEFHSFRKSALLLFHHVTNTVQLSYYHPRLSSPFLRI